jgi:hypothetical protein
MVTSFVLVGLLEPAVDGRRCRLKLLGQLISVAAVPHQFDDLLAVPIRIRWMRSRQRELFSPLRYRGVLEIGSTPWIPDASEHPMLDSPIQ